MAACTICGGACVQISVRERMLGLGELFVYDRCGECGHAHIGNIPSDLSKYYNSNEYYSFSDKNSFAADRDRKTGLKSALKKMAMRLGSRKNILYSAALNAFLSIKNMNRRMNVLDYGCGAGQFVKELADIGFSEARGYDPFLQNTIAANGEIYLSNNLGHFTKRLWDVVTLNHVFEHVHDPIQTLKDIHRLLASGGRLLLRFPVIDSYAFETYGVNWVQFDAPRHINLFTRRSIRLAVAQAGGYKFENMYDDSFHFQFTGSELYRKQLTLKPQDNNLRKRLFSYDAYRYHFLAKKLNRQNKGDQIVVILEKI